MRRYIKKMLLEMKTDLYSMFDMIQIVVLQGDREQLCQLAGEFQQVLIEFGGVIEQETGPESETVKCLEQICEMLYRLTQEKEEKASGKLIKKVRRLLYAFENYLKYDVPDDKLKIVFFPYKASMWTSFESIWRSALQDETCEVSVVPVPYCEYGKRAGEWYEKYEIDGYPDYVPVIHYEKYSLCRERPDIAFIHNPYDDKNTLTSVLPEYYSKNIKEYAGLLVYSPYHTIGNFTRGQTDRYILAEAMLNVDKIIVQSKFVKKIFESYGYPPERLIAYGSPKADAAIRFSKKHEIPERWKKKLGGKKKIFLLNTHWAYFMSGKVYEKEHGVNFAEQYHNEFIRTIEKNKEECGMIWRPHPLMLPAVRQRLPECMEYINEFAQRIEGSDYGVIDDSPGYEDAFSCSDALVSTYSSLINEYLVTGKPVILFQTKPTDEMGERSPVDYRSCYFRRKADNGMPFEKFVNMVLSGEDPMKTERMNILREKSFDNLDGTAGEKIYFELKKYYE